MRAQASEQRENKRQAPRSFANQGNHEFSFHEHRRLRIAGRRGLCWFQERLSKNAELSVMIVQLK
jgi:hypothetical protein